MEVLRMTGDRKKRKFNLGLTFSKYLLFLINVVYVICSVLMISGGSSTFTTVHPFRSDLGDGFRMMSIFWLIVGLVFFLVAIFGIFVAFKESPVLAGLYKFAILVVLLSQLSAAIACFSQITRSRQMASDHLEMMIRYYDYEYRREVDWIQSKFECCGINGPSDWQIINRFYYKADQYNRSIETDAFVPASCCVQHSNYVNFTCDKYHTAGCFEPSQEIVLESIITIGTSALVVAFLQMLGVVLGFMYARIVRRKKTEGYVQIWNSGQSQEYGSRSSPPWRHANSLPIDNGGNVK